MCEILNRPRARGAYLIRTCVRRGFVGTHPLPVIEIYVCSGHHPNPERAGSTPELSAEVNAHLKRLGLAVEHVYLYVFRRE